MSDSKIDKMIVQKYDNGTSSWRVINARIFVRDYQREGVPYAVALERARQEADRQVSGWSAAYPLREYRAIEGHDGSL